MLTKSQLKYRTRSGKVKSVYASIDKADTAELAERLVQLFSEFSGLSRAEAEEELSDVSGNQAMKEAFTKILFSRCDEAQDDGEIAVDRVRFLAESEKIRRTGEYSELLEFQAELSKRLGLSIEEISERLYGDLPECRKISGFKETTPAELVQRYNLAQVQGLLLRTSVVTLTFKASLAEKRKIFRSIRFHRLIADVVEDDKKKGLTLSLGGPLSIFEGSQSYGMRLANFFPHIVHLEKWKLVAELNIKDKDLTMSLSEKDKLVSHYDNRKSYIPEELTAFIDKFNTNEKGWKAEIGGDFVKIGQQSYCFPDVTLSTNAKKVYIELFHKWHSGQLCNRLKALEKSPVPNLFLGVAKTLQKEKNTANLLKESTWFETNGFSFSSFPTTKTVLALLDE